MNKVYQIGTTLLLNGLMIFGFAQGQQKHTIQSIEDELQHYIQQDNKSKALESYVRLGKHQIESGQGYAAIESFEAALAISHALSDYRKAFEIHYLLGEEFRMQGQFQLSLRHFRTCLRQSSIKDMEKISVYSRIGEILSEMGDYESAYTFLLKAEYLINHGTKLETEVNIQFNYSMGHALYYMKKYERSLLYYSKALELSVEEEEADWRFSCLTAIGGAYREMKDYQKATEYFKEALRLSQISEKHLDYSYVFLNLGITQLHLKTYSSAKIYLESALENARKLQDKTLEANCLYFLGKVYVFQKDWRQGIEYLESAMDLAEEIPRRKFDIMALVAETYVELGNYQKAYQYILQRNRMKDSLFAEDIALTEERLRKEHEANFIREKLKSLEAEDRLRTEKQQLYWTVAAMSIVFLILILWLNQSKLQYQLRANEKLEEKNQEIFSKNLKLAKSNDALEQFAYVASHDLQEPLRMIENFSHLLHRRYQDQLDQTGKDFIYYISDAVKRMSGMLQDLLSFASLTTHNETFERVDMNKSIEVVLKTLQHKVEDAKASVTIQELPYVYGNPVQLNQLFQNLLTNALKFRAEDPLMVRIGYHSKGGWDIFSVSDNGIGIPRKEQSAVFEMFHRLNASQSNGGTGIGLATCRKIMQNHKGKIWLTSEPGHGTTFYAAFPREMG